jgi:hypothetical protein
MHDMHHMAVAHYAGLALAVPAFLVVMRASWRSFTTRSEEEHA